MKEFYSIIFNGHATFGSNDKNYLVAKSRLFNVILNHKEMGISLGTSFKMVKAILFIEKWNDITKVEGTNIIIHKEFIDKELSDIKGAEDFVTIFYNSCGENRYAYPMLRTIEGLNLPDAFNEFIDLYGSQYVCENLDFGRYAIYTRDILVRGEEIDSIKFDEYLSGKTCCSFKVKGIKHAHCCGGEYRDLPDASFTMTYYEKVF